MKNPLFIFMLTAVMSANALAASPNAVKGSEVFATECAECHSVKDGKQKRGPSMFGVLGRKSGSISDFVYSDALRKSEIVWTADKIQAYVKNPKGLIPSGKMKYEGLSDPQEMSDLIQYLSTLK